MYLNFKDELEITIDITNNKYTAQHYNIINNTVYTHLLPIKYILFKSSAFKEIFFDF